MKTRQRVRRALIFGSFALLPITLYYFSPVMSLGGTAFGIVTGSLLIFAVQFLFSLFVGRLFCGWACPVGGLQEAVALLRGKPVNRRRIGWIKWLIWAPWVAAVAFFALRAGGFNRVDVSYQTWHGISVADLPSLIAYVAVVALFLVLSLTVSRRAGCHTVCWMAPFMVIGRKIRNVFAWPSLRHLRGRLPQEGDPLHFQRGEGVMKGMRSFVVCAAFLLALVFGLPAQARAQAQSLVPGLDGFGGPHFKLSLLNGAPVMFGGGPAYAIVNRWLSVGVSGSYREGDADELMMGYGGPSVGISLFPGSWLGGWLACSVGPGWAEVPDAGAGEPAGTGLLVIEPEAAVTIAFGSSSRIGLGGSYRLAIPFQPLAGLGWRDLSGFSAMLTLQYGVFQPREVSDPDRSRLSLAGCVSQKFSLVRGQIARFDGGYTRLIIDHRWAIGARGSRVADGILIGRDSFRMMEAGVWGEYFIAPDRPVNFSLGTLAGVAMVGYISSSTGELVGSPALLLNPECHFYLNLMRFARLGFGAGFRLAVPFTPVAGLSFWDTSGPTVSVELSFGVF